MKSVTRKSDIGGMGGNLRKSRRPLRLSARPPTEQVVAIEVATKEKIADRKDADTAHRERRKDTLKRCVN